MRALGVLAVALVFGACSTIPTYDQTAYEKVTAAKVEALFLMDRGTES
ncbi:MAG: hypothetical protein ABIR71_06685 [Chthoniobacterales bacterium]